MQISIPFFTSPLRHLPSPRGERFPLGHLSLHGGKPLTDNIANMLKSTPNDGLLVCWGLFYLNCVIVPTRPDTIMDVLNTHNYHWEKPAGTKRLLSRILGEGLINVEGNKHKSMRKVVAPAFSGRHIRDLVPLFYAKGLSFADSIAREAQKSTDGLLEMMAQSSRVTLDIIGAAGVGKDFNTIENDENPLANLYATVTHANRGPLLLFLFVDMMIPPWIIRHLRGTVYARLAKTHTQLRKDVCALMQEKKQMILDKSEQQKDIIAIIMRSGDFSDDYLVDQLLTFLAAGWGFFFYFLDLCILFWRFYVLTSFPQSRHNCISIDMDNLVALCEPSDSRSPAS